MHIPDKLREFRSLCAQGKNNNVDAERYIRCKQLLADMKKELGEASKIVWYTPRAFFMIQVIEDIQENLDHILAKFDEAAIEAFTVDCSCDKGVTLDFNDGEGEILVDLIGDANSADVTVRFIESSSCTGSPADNCKLVNEFDADDYGECIQVYDCTNSEEGPGEIYVTSSNGQSIEVRAIAHGPCGLEDDQFLPQRPARVKYNSC